MTIEQALKTLSDSWRQAGIENHEMESRWALQDLMQMSWTALLTQKTQALTSKQQEIVKSFDQRRKTGEPLAHILQSQEFMGLDFFVNKHVLIPRADSESVVRQALEILKGRNQVRIADFGTGSGCLIISLLKKLPNAEGVAIEQSVEAIAVAKTNAEKHQVLSRLQLIHADVTQAQLQGPFDLIIANPPYIDPKDPMVEDSVRRFEPASALFAEESGTYCLRLWPRIAEPLLAQGGAYLSEIGMQQAETAKTFLRQIETFDRIQSGVDDQERPRWVCAFKTIPKKGT